MNRIKTPLEMESWCATAMPGDVAVYHVGPYLTHDHAEIGRTARALGNRVFLCQRRHARFPANFEYLAIRISRETAEVLDGLQDRAMMEAA